MQRLVSGSPVNLSDHGRRTVKACSPAPRNANLLMHILPTDRERFDVSVR